MSEEAGKSGDRTAEEASREERERLIAILDATNDMVGTATTDGHITFINRAGREMLGWEEYEESGYPKIDKAHPEWAATKIEKEGIPAAIRDGVWKGETAILGPAGEEITVSQVIMSHRDPEGELAYLSTIIRDISDLKSTERKLQETQALLLAALEQSPAGILIADAPDVKIRYANSAALGIRGDAVMPLTDIPVDFHPQNWQVFHPDGTQFEPEDLPLSGAVLFGNSSQNVDAIIRRPDGEERWVLANAAPVRNPEGEIIAGVVVFPDITERKKAEEEKVRLEAQLRQAQKMEAVGQLAGGVAHDFNNILTAILGNLELAMLGLGSTLDPDDPLIRGLKQAERSAQRASALTRQLLAFSRRQVSQPKVLDLNRTLAEMEKMLRRLVKEDIELVTYLAEDLRNVRADAGQIEQVVMNLVVNAVDAMPDGGSLTILTANAVLDEAYCQSRAEVDPGEYVSLAVRDTGCGMDDRTVDRIFEPFFTTKAVGQGTGLGLSMVYGIVRQAGGHVSVSSEPGRGSTFRIYLPVEEEAPAEPAEPVAPHEEFSGSETILVCEDDPAVRGLAVLILEGAGYRVIAADKSKDAIRSAQEYGDRIDLLITDVIMPDMNGRRLAETLSVVRPYLRTLYMSGYTANIIAKHGVLEDGIEFLEKPFTRRSLLKRVRELLDA